MIDRLRSARRVVLVTACFTAILAGAGCKKEFPDDPINPDAMVAVDGAVAIDGAMAIDGAAACNPGNEVPTYTELYDKYFAVGKPGHCATEDCHGQTSFNSWKCGDSKDTCFNGMVGQKLINKANPLLSLIADPKNSPLKWVNHDHGFMPQDTPTPMDFPEGRDAIIAWVGACAQNN